MPHTVTLQDLETLRACPEQRELFASTFPEGVTITPDNAAVLAKAAAEAGLDVGWYAGRALTAPEWVAYEAAVAPAWAAFEAAVARAWAAYDAAVTLTWTYEAAEAAYDTAVAAARAARDAAVAEVICAILARRGEPC